MIKVTNAVTVYENDGKETSGLPLPTILVEAHWNRKSLIVLVVAGQRVTVAAQDLQAAIANATNTGSL